jgi:hypothetical protein
MLAAAEALARTAVDLLTQPATVAQAWARFGEQVRIGA